MKPPIATTLGLTCLLAAPVVLAQAPAPPGGGRPSVSSFFRRGTQPAPTPDGSAAAFGRGAQAPAAADPKADPKVFPASSPALPTPTPPDQIKPATLELPNDPIEPYLLTRDNGPFMVMAKTFRGPDAERYALALLLELKREYGLPAYILRTKDFPNRSNIRNVPPTAPEYVRQAQVTMPEKVRTYDEAAVLVGNEKTEADALALLHRVRKIKPKCLDEVPSLFGWRKGLSTAQRTTNPYVPAQDIYPGRRTKDHLLVQMNSGPHSVTHCPGRYALQVAEFGGRTVINPDQRKDASIFDNGWLRKSPLATAADDAERLAEALAKDPELRRAGVQAFVYHDRTSSKVLIGSFNSPNDPNAAPLRDTLLKIAVPLAQRERTFTIAPANYLTDLEDPNKPIKLTAMK